VSDAVKRYKMASKVSVHQMYFSTLPYDRPADLHRPTCVTVPILT